MYIKAATPNKNMSLTPINYDLTFEPHFDNFTFTAKEILHANIPSPTGTVQLDAAELKIKRCAVIFGGSLLKTRTVLNEKSESLLIHLPRKIKGDVAIEIDFTGILNDRLVGFYRSQYKDQSGKTKYIATTQFEAADARRAFPCIDEPKAKATFDITIITEKNHTAISNMNLVSKMVLGSKISHKFARTPIMSTYLVYLGAGEFEFLSSRQGNVQYRIVTTKGNSEKGRFALSLCKRLVTSYEQYFGIKYPLPKLDLIAVPDFASGAMENWGAITFRETILLYDPKTSSTQTKQFIAEVVSHELAHQWFGNLVTMEWWNDLWLNESFATFMATKFVDKFYPEWKLWDQFLEDAMNTAMGLDALHSSHPIDVKVREPSEIREIFDAISYDKGGCVLRMLENYVTEAKFRQGLRNYLKKYSYKNAKGDDLWMEIGRASKMPVPAMVNSWIRQVGFPMVDAETQNEDLILRQKRFVYQQKGKQKGQWHIPVSVKSDKKILKKLVTKKHDRMKVTSPSLVINSGRPGFYRVKYSPDLLSGIKPVIAAKSVSHIDRWAVQNDLYALCISGDDQVRRYLEFIDAYEEEDDYIVLSNVAGNLFSIYSKTLDEPFSYLIRDAAYEFFNKVFARLGWDAKKGEPHTNALLRSQILSALGRLDDEDVILEANVRFKRYLKRPQSLNPDIQGAVFGIVAWSGNRKTYDTLLRLFRGAKSQEEKLRFLSALCSFKDPDLLLRTLNFSQTSEVRSQNMQLPIIQTASNPHGKKILWPWLVKNWNKIRNKVGPGSPLLNRIVSSITLVADASMEKDVERFFRKNPTPGTERTVEQTLERMRINAAFLQRTRQEYS